MEKPKKRIFISIIYVIGGGIIASLIAYVIIQIVWNRPTPPPISTAEWISVSLDDKYNKLENEGTCTLRYMSLNKDNRLNIRLELNGLKPNHHYVLTLNGKPGELGNDNLRRFNKTDGEGYYDFEEINTDSQGNKHNDFIARNLPAGEYKVKFLVKDKTDYQVVLLNDNLYFAIE